MDDLQTEPVELLSPAVLTSLTSLSLVGCLASAALLLLLFVAPIQISSFKCQSITSDFMVNAVNFISKSLTINIILLCLSVLCIIFYLLILFLSIRMCISQQKQMINSLFFTMSMILLVNIGLFGNCVKYVVCLNEVQTCGDVKKSIQTSMILSVLSGFSLLIITVMMSIIVLVKKILKNKSQLDAQSIKDKKKYKNSMMHDQSVNASPQVLSIVQSVQISCTPQKIPPRRPRIFQRKLLAQSKYKNSTSSHEQISKQN